MAFGLIQIKLGRNIMRSKILLQTPRLVIRQWIEDDLAPFANLNADPDVMEYFPTILTPEQSNAAVSKTKRQIDHRGWGFSAVEEKTSGQFIGFVGIHEPNPPMPFSPCVEIGWRLAKPYWGKGYATEAAKAWLNHAFSVLEMDEIVSFTATTNVRSQAVMKRIGMKDSKQNFNHPALPEGHLLQEHVLYKISQPLPG